MAQIRRSVAASRLQDTVEKGRCGSHLKLEADIQAVAGKQCTKVERKTSSGGRSDPCAGDNLIQVSPSDRSRAIDQVPLCGREAFLLTTSSEDLP